MRDIYHTWYGCPVYTFLSNSDPNAMAAGQYAERDREKNAEQKSNKSS